MWAIATKQLSGTIRRTSQTVTDGVERVIPLCLGVKSQLEADRHNSNALAVSQFITFYWDTRSGFGLLVETTGNYHFIM